MAQMTFHLGVEDERESNNGLINSSVIRVQDEEEKLNNPQPSVIRGHGRSCATLSSFVLEDAAPPTLRAWSLSG